MLNLFVYPIMLDTVEIKKYLDIDLSNKEQKILDDTHEYIYDFLIYPTFNSDIKNRIIEKYKAELEKPIKRALLEQFKYLYENGGDLGTWNGILKSGQVVDSKENQDILTKLLSPKVINILKGAAIDILYAGG